MKNCQKIAQITSLYFNMRMKERERHLKTLKM